jgi:hypothetical protein
MCGTFDTKTNGIQKWIDQDNIDIALMKIQHHTTLSIVYSSEQVLKSLNIKTFELQLLIWLRFSSFNSPLNLSFDQSEFTIVKIAREMKRRFSK